MNRYETITETCENCYGTHATDAEWDACWAEEDEYSAALDENGSNGANGANVLAYIGACPSCGRIVETWETVDGSYSVRLDEGTKVEHED